MLKTNHKNTRGGIPYYNRTEFPPHSTNTSVYPQVCNFISPDYYCGITKQEFVDNGYEITRYFSEAKAKTHYKINNKSASTFFIETMPMLAIREGYRMKCEYMVTQKDVETTITSENYAEAQLRLGLCYETGVGVNQNLEKAKEWYNKCPLPEAKQRLMALEK